MAREWKVTTARPGSAGALDEIVVTADMAQGGPHVAVLLNHRPGGADETVAIFPIDKLVSIFETQAEKT